MNDIVIKILRDSQYAWTVVGNSSPELQEMARAQHQKIEEIILSLQLEAA